MVPQGKYLLVTKGQKFTYLLLVQMVCGPEALDIEIEMIFDFLGEIIAQEKVLLSSCRGSLTEIILFPQNHPLP
jgi:hypothetical protein